MKTRNSHHFWSCNVTTYTREPTTRAWISANIWRQDGAICSKNRKIVPYHGSAWIPRLTVSVPDYGSCYDTCGRGNFWIWREKVTDSKISRYVWTASVFTWIYYMLAHALLSKATVQPLYNGQEQSLKWPLRGSRGVMWDLFYFQKCNFAYFVNQNVSITNLTETEINRARYGSSLPGDL